MTEPIGLPRFDVVIRHTRTGRRTFRSYVAADEASARRLAEEGIAKRRRPDPRFQVIDSITRRVEYVHTSHIEPKE